MNTDLVKTLDILQIAGDSIAQAIIEDFVIFDLVPKAMKYGTEISVEIVKASPKVIEAGLQGSAANIEAMGTLAEKSGKGIKAAEGILGGF